MKAFRLRDFTNLFKPLYIRPIIRKYYHDRLSQVLLDEDKKDNINESNNFIMERLKAQNYVNASRIILGLVFTAFYGGTIWFAMVNQYLKNDDDDLDFPSVFLSKLENDLDKEILSIYFSFTTMSTVGLGDIYPISDKERVFGTLGLFLGVVLFSYIGESFGQMMTILSTFDKDYEEEEQLQTFFVMLRKYNSGQRIDIEFENKLTDFFHHKWSYDRNYSIMD
mmetsp:Transcript_41030/g.62412  ORF Transcript_41030/g.62412 Transcript_41030/m.62412 type:complete len:223 (-) Transcript_41030:986-1654(-)